MPEPKTNDLLNRLYVLHHRSLPMYLHYAPPYQLGQNGKARSTLAQIVADHTHAADRLANLILENGGLVDPGEFPMSFTGLHDLSVEYLLGQVIDRQKRHIKVCEQLAKQLAADPLAQAKALEIVGEAKGHLANLEELAAAMAPA
jgi:hypothetical protein